MSITYHLAQVNIAHANAPMDDPIMEGFASRLDEINALAEATPGFVWRLQSDSGNATDILAFDDPTLLINMSVWTSVEALEGYTYRSEHVALLRQRKLWFKKPEGPHQVLWWIPAGTLPTTEDAKARLQLLAAHGPTPKAFTFKQSFPPPIEPTVIKPEATIADLDKLDIRIGTILSVADVPRSKKLMQLRVDFGDHERTILAGIKQERSDPQEIVGVQALFVVNLPPRKLSGIVSEGMLFDIGYADGITPVLAIAEKPIPNGTRAG